MNWKEFKNNLEENRHKFLQFQYEKNKNIDPSYHITEIKKASINSVDCGGNLDSWEETIVQVVEYKKNNFIEPMKISKALSIISIVENKIQLSSNSIVKIEFGNSEFIVSQMIPTLFKIDDDSLTIKLASDTTGCKPSFKGLTCGTNNSQTFSKEHIWKKEMSTSCCG